MINEHIKHQLAGLSPAGYAANFVLRWLEKGFLTAGIIM